MAAAAHFGAMADGLFAAAPYRRSRIRGSGCSPMSTSAREILQGEMPDYTCLLGTMVQETYATHPAIRDACEREIIGHATTLEADIAAALAPTGRPATWTPASLALHIQAVLQGAFILAKATGGAEVAADSLATFAATSHFCSNHKPKGRHSMSYVDGFVVAVPTANRETYRDHAERRARCSRNTGRSRSSSAGATTCPRARSRPSRWR